MILNKIYRRIQHLPYFFISCDELIVVTGADSSHYKSLNQFLSSLFRHEPNIKTIVYDLGLTKYESEYLKSSFPIIEVKLFDYSKYPSYFDITVNAGEYAWKPIVLYDTLNEYRSNVCWMDAGNLITEPLVWIRKIVKRVGVYTPYSSGRISDWTHPKTLEFLGASEDILDKYNLNGACVAVSFQSSNAKNLVSRWRKCALIKECIAPLGSSRKNHRQDQAVLSVIAYQSGITKHMPTRLYGFKTHQDVEKRS